MEQTPLQEHVKTSSLPSPQQLQTKPSVTARNVISVSAAGLGASFFMPWMMFLGGNITGLDIQKNFPSYKLVWLLPACAAYVLIMNMAGKSKASDRRITVSVTCDTP
jgi:hypothetical protein